MRILNPVRLPELHFYVCNCHTFLHSCPHVHLSALACTNLQRFQNNVTDIASSGKHSIFENMHRSKITRSFGWKAVRDHRGFKFPLRSYDTPVCNFRAEFSAYVRLKYDTINTVGIFIISSEMVLSVSIKLNFYEHDKDSDTLFFQA